MAYGQGASLELYIQTESSGKDKEANWLPSPESGRVVLQMRVYEPKAEALDGRWVPPLVERVID